MSVRSSFPGWRGMPRGPRHLFYARVSRVFFTGGISLRTDFDPPCLRQAARLKVPGGVFLGRLRAGIRVRRSPRGARSIGPAEAYDGWAHVLHFVSEIGFGLAERLAAAVGETDA